MSTLLQRLKKYRYWSESIVLGTTLDIKPGKLLNEQEALASIKKDIESARPPKMNSESPEMLARGWFDSEWVAYNQGVKDFMERLERYIGYDQ